MENSELDIVLDCLGSHRRTFRYFKDKYCLDLLERELQGRPGEAAPLRELRDSRWASFLHRPVLKAVIGRCGDGVLRRSQLQQVWCDNELAFNLTLGSWRPSCKCCTQASRRGSSMVLQLNFDRRHNRAYQQLLELSQLPEHRRRYFNAKAGVNGGNRHPVNRSRGFTMSWVRMDVDLERGECLVEEVQNDWLRHSASLAQRFEGLLQRDKVRILERAWPHFRGHYREFIDYVDAILKPYRDIWAEASLAAAIDFVRGELGEMDIYYHSAESGAALKGIKSTLPPRSLYTRLPERFGLQLTDEVPKCLQENAFSRRCIKALKAKGVPVHFYRL